MQIDSSNFKVDKETYKAITDAVLKCAIDCFTKGQQHKHPIDTIKEEYQYCIDTIFKALGGVIKQ